jgi:hypothetical protein
MATVNSPTQTPGTGVRLPANLIRLGGMNIANKCVALLVNCRDSFVGIGAEELARLRDIGQAIHADIDYRRARLDECAANECWPPNSPRLGYQPGV